MKRSILSRLLWSFALVFAVMLAAAGIFLEKFLTERHTGLLQNELEVIATLAHTAIGNGGDDIEKVVKKFGQDSGLRLTVIDGAGVVLADSVADSEKMDNHATRVEIAGAIGGAVGVSQRKSSTLGVELMYLAIPTAPVVRAAKPMDEVNGIIAQTRSRIVLAGLLAFMLAILLSYFLATRFSIRLKKMEVFAGKLARGFYDEKLEVQSDDELGGLESSLDKLGRELGDYVMQLDNDRQKLTTIMDALPEAVLLFNSSRRLTAANATAIKLLKLTASAMEGLSIEEVFRIPQALKLLGEALEGGKDRSTPKRILWPEPLLDLELSVHDVTDTSGDGGVLVILRDVTRQAHLEQVRTDFITNMAHELRTPLTAIRGSAETLLDNEDHSPEIGRRFLGTISRHSLRLGNILSDISQLAHLESGVAPVEVDAHDPRRVLQEVAELFRAEAEKAEIGLTVDFSGIPGELISDQEKIESILVNLVQNAIRYTPAGGQVKLIGRNTPDGNVIYEVIDSGIGIPPSELPRVTERFYRVDPGRSREKGGTGLGLSIVKHLISVLDGELEIESEHGHGTTVRVKLPSLNTDR